MPVVEFVCLLKSVVLLFYQNISCSCAISAGEGGMTVILWDIGLRVIYSHKFGEIVHNNPYDFQGGLTLIVLIGDFHMKKH